MDCKYLVLFVLLCIRIHSYDVAANEYCNRETFKAECPSGEVIIMENATYGRMRIGKCIEYNVRLDCSISVMGIVDRWCSGKQSCSFDVQNDDFDAIEPCNARGLVSNLEASYSCLKVSTESSCTIMPAVFDETVYLFGMNSQCGRVSVPLKIKANPGQRIRLNMYDFTSSLNHHSCTPLGYISESITRSNKTICLGSGPRNSEIYISVSSEIEIRYQKYPHQEHMHQFVIGYTFLGCPDPTLVGNVWYKRDGNTAKGGCKDSDDVWELECVNYQWEGDYKNCSDSSIFIDTDSDESKAVSSFATLPEYTIVVIIISISVLVSATVLVVGVVYTLRNRHTKHTPVNTGTLPLTQDTIYTHNKKYGVQYGQPNVATYAGATYKPVQHASTCKRNKSGQYSNAPLDPDGVNVSLKNEAASWNYKIPKPHYVQRKLADVGTPDYESPYDTCAPESHKYFPLETNSSLPAANEL